jgi:thiol-disulfide isomerase/thioredoxin
VSRAPASRPLAPYPLISPAGVSRRSLLGAAAGLAGIAAAGRAAASAPAFDVSRYRGRVVYLDFWASWCAPCKLSFPYMGRFAARFAHDPFTLIAVNVDHSRTRAEAFLADMGQPLSVIFDSRGAIATQFNVKAMPTSVLIGRDGRIRYIHQGFFPDQVPAYEAHIQELLHET